MNDPSKVKRKFSSFFKSLVIELNKDLYGPDNHLVEVTAVSCSHYCGIAVMRSSRDSVVQALHLLNADLTPAETCMSIDDIEKRAWSQSVAL